MQGLPEIAGPDGRGQTGSNVEGLAAERVRGKWEDHVLNALFVAIAASAT